MGSPSRTVPFGARRSAAHAADGRSPSAPPSHASAVSPVYRRWSGRVQTTQRHHPFAPVGVGDRCSRPPTTAPAPAPVPAAAGEWPTPPAVTRCATAGQAGGQREHPYDCQYRPRVPSPAVPIRIHPPRMRRGGGGRRPPRLPATTVRAKPDIPQETTTGHQIHPGDGFFDRFTAAGSSARSTGPDHRRAGVSPRARRAALPSARTAWGPRRTGSRGSRPCGRGACRPACRGRPPAPLRGWRRATCRSCARV